MLRAMICLVSVTIAALLSASGALAQTAGPRVFRDCRDCPEMIAVPAGDFLMGSPESEYGRDADEGPQRRVVVPAFALAKYELSDTDVAPCIAAGRCRSWATYEDYRYVEIPSPHTVIPLQYQIAEYLAYLSERSGHTYRLPSEAEWEYAARAGTTTPWFWGDEPDVGCDYGNIVDLTLFGPDGPGNIYTQDLPNIQSRGVASACTDGYAGSSARGLFRPNPWGFYDMIGGEQEIMADCYMPNYSGRDSSARAYPQDNCEARVIRGGSSGDGGTRGGGPNDLRSASRLEWGMMYELRDDRFSEGRLVSSGYTIRVARDMPD